MARRQGKGARARAKARRRLQKRAKKEANRERWRAMALLGQNTKSKRYIKNSKSRKLLNHPNGMCGNLACNRCYPEYPPEK